MTIPQAVIIPMSQTRKGGNGIPGGGLALPSNQSQVSCWKMAMHTSLRSGVKPRLAGGSTVSSIIEDASFLGRLNGMELGLFLTSHGFLHLQQNCTEVPKPPQTHFLLHQQWLPRGPSSPRSSMGLMWKGKRRRQGCGMRTTTSLKD